MGFVWLGAYEGYETDANARHRDGFVWLGAYEGYETDADARYRDGFVWLGAYEGYPSASPREEALNQRPRIRQD